MSEDLAKLFPDRELTLSNGEVLTLRPFYFGQYPKAIKMLRPVTDAVRDAGIAGFNGAQFSLASDWAMRLPQLMDEAGEALVEFVAFAVDKPRSWFDTLPGDDGILLTKAAFEVNGDFFVQRVAPKLGMALPPIGEPSQPDLSPSATPGTPSEATP